MPRNKDLKDALEKNLPGDNKKVKDVILAAASKAGVKPELLYSSAYQEGLDKAIAKPELISEAYYKASKSDPSYKDFPVDGFYNYGLDRFDEMYPGLVKEGYMKEDFKPFYKSIPATNERGEKISSAAFQNNQDALYVKGVLLKREMDHITKELQKRNIKADSDTVDYLTMASYNGGRGYGNKILEEVAKGRKVTSGDTDFQQIYSNISPRLQNLKDLQSDFSAPTNELLAKMSALIKK